MTSRTDIGHGDFGTLDVDALLESYVLSTRIGASEPFVRRINDRIAQEPPATPWRRAWRSVRDIARTAFGREQVAAAVRLQALALLIIGTLALGMAVGGAGVVLVSIVREATQAEPGPHRPNGVFPVATAGISPSVPSAAPTAPTDSAALSPTPKPKTGQNHHSGDAVSAHPTHGGSAAGGAQKTPAPRPTHSPRPTQAPPTIIPAGGDESPGPTISATPDPTVTPMPTGTPAASPDPSSSPEQSPEASATAGSTAPPTATPTTEPTAEPVPPAVPVPSIEPTVGPTPEASPSPS